METSATLGQFARQNQLEGLTDETIGKIYSRESDFTVDRAKKFISFQNRIQNELLNHRIIKNNEYTAWFSKGEATPEQVKAFIVQFSVFSNLFIIAQLKKVINANSIDNMRASKEILVNELGVVFRPKHQKNGGKSEDRLEYDLSSDPELVSPDGTVEGGTFRFSAAHFEWLVRIAEELGLGFNDIGKRRHGTPSTLFFCDELERLYGGSDYEISQAASYAVENWAAAGFWKELIQGLQAFKKNHQKSLPLGFFVYHDRLESQHAAHTQEELEEYYFHHPELNEDDFIRYGNEMLEGVSAFWDGLNEQRKK